MCSRCLTRISRRGEKILKSARDDAHWVRPKIAILAAYGLLAQCAPQTRRRPVVAVICFDESMPFHDTPSQIPDPASHWRVLFPCQFLLARTGHATRTRATLIEKYSTRTVVCMELTFAPITRYRAGKS